MKWFYIIMLLAIVASLFSALFALMKADGKDNTRTLKALTLRVGLSLLLFIILVVTKTAELSR